MTEEKSNQRTRRKVLLFILIPLITVIVLTASLFFAGVIKIPLFSEEVPSDDEYVNETEQFDGDILNRNDSEYTVYTPQENEDPFELITEHSSYKRELRVISISGNEYSVEKYSIIKKGNNFLIESDSKTVICSGEKLYIAYPSDHLVTVSDQDSIYSEIGITSLGSIKSRAEYSLYDAELINNGKTISVKFSEDDRGFSDEYRISVETGIVTEEYSSLNGVVFRSVVTDLFEVFTADDIEDSIFAIPSEE